jgi:hypothetical protein
MDGKSGKQMSGKKQRYIPMSDKMQSQREAKIANLIRTPSYQVRQMLLRMGCGQELELMTGEKVVKLKNYKGNMRCRNSSNQVMDYKIKKFKFYHVQIALMQ